MAVYAVGDIQGCYDCLRRLMDKLAFDSETDRLWLTGDIVNRGPKSLKTLRFVKSMGDGAITVLGNHDLHLLAVAEFPERIRSKDTLDNILKASDRDELLDWLRHRPLMHYDKKLRFALVHAGLSPQWNLDTALGAARELESVLQDDRCRKFLRKMYGDTPNLWTKKLNGLNKLRYITNCFTRMRLCDRKGRLELTYKGSLIRKKRKYVPWFRVPGRASEGLRIVFGHWSTLGPVMDEDIWPLDTGCVWGGRLTALRLDKKTPKRTSIRCRQVQKPD